MTITVKHHAILVDDAAVVTVVALGLALSFSPSSHSSRCDVSRCVAPVSISGARTHSHTRQRDAPSHRIAHWGGRDEGGTGRRPTDRGPLTIPSSPHRSSFVHPFVVRVGRGPILFQLSSLFLPPFLSRMQSPNGRGRLPLVAAAWSEPILPCPPGSLESSDAPWTPRPSRLDLQGDHQHRRVVIRPREQRFPSIPLFICPRFSVSRPS